MAGRATPDFRAMTVGEVASHLHALAAPDPALLRRLSRDPRAGVRALAAHWRRRLAQDRTEWERLDALLALEREKMAQGLRRVAGLDEAGRGPLAGPVVAATVVLRAEAIPRGLDDSKRLPATRREQLYDEIMVSGAQVGVGIAEVEEIDRYNILGACRVAWGRALAGMGDAPDFLVIDGRDDLAVAIPHLALIDADARVACVAAASIVAKVTRDRLMLALHDRYPHYGFADHKGYGTRSHWAAIEKHGPSPVHRRSFLAPRTIPLWPELEPDAPSPLRGERVRVRGPAP
ncbi:MAG: ribonuclease HII [Armatimonadetes bacterium]|nr:ribonuclease HII [Armatimonadota bacterium]